MSDDYTPTEEEVRDWWLGDMQENSAERFERELEFDRFIAQVKAEALEEAASLVLSEIPRTSPYRSQDAAVVLRSRAAEYRNGART